VIAKLRSPKDFWTGTIYLAAGMAGLFIARGYSFGSAGRMGPGYFPMVISGLLVVFGAVSVLRAFMISGEPVGALNWKGIALITGSVLAFGYLLQPAGLVVALLALILTSAAASERFGPDWRAGLGLAALIAFCALVFVQGLGLPMPLLGEWIAFGPSGSPG
jgi:hypothetical protein